MTGGGSSPLVRAEDQTEDAVEDLAEGEDDPDADPDAEATVESDDPPGEGAGDDSTVAETDKVGRIDKNLKIYLFLKIAFLLINNPSLGQHSTLMLILGRPWLLKIMDGSVFMRF